MHRQGYRNFTNAEQSGNERYVKVTWEGGQFELDVPIDNSSTTSGVFAANPHRPTFNPYKQRSTHKNKRYLKHKRNRKYKEKQYKFTYEQQREREQNPERKKLKRGVETEKQKGKRLPSAIENPPQIRTDPQIKYSTPSKRSKRGPQPHSAEDHNKNSNNRKRTRAQTDTQL